VALADLLRVLDAGYPKPAEDRRPGLRRSLIHSLWTSPESGLARS